MDAMTGVVCSWGHAIDDSRPLRSSCLLSALDFGRTAPRTGKWFFFFAALMH